MHPDIKVRLERLIQGPIRNEDLSALFLAMREMDHVGAPVTEVGHFLAHRGSRKLGPPTALTKDVSVMVRFQLWRLQGGRVSFAALPRDFYDVVQFNWKHVDRNRLVKDIRLPLDRKGTAALYRSAFSKLVQTDDSTFLSGTPTFNEIRMLRRLSEYLIAKPLFTDKDLVGDFFNTLRQNGLLSESESKHTKGPLSGPLCVFAMAAMHMSRIDADNRITIPLAAGYHWNPPKRDARTLSVSATYKGSYKGKQIALALPFFDTDMKADDWCEPALIADQPFKVPTGVVDPATYKPGRTWLHPLEMSPRSKLMFLDS